MRNLLAVTACAAAFLTGCKTEQMKSTPLYEGHDVVYTGALEDRVNLWPLAYWREPVGSVLWPLLSFADDHFAFRPLYSRYKDEQNFLWPWGQYDAKAQEGRFLPAMWGKDYFDLFPLVWNHEDFHSLFPLVYYWENSYLSVFPLLWWNIEEDSFVLFPVCGHDKERDWLFPLYYRDDDITLLTPLAGANKRGDNWLIPLYYYGADGAFATPVCGQTKDANWLLPIFYNDSDSFISLFWSGHWDKSGKLDWWIAPPLLTEGVCDQTGTGFDVLASIAGARWDGPKGARCSWFFPFWYEDSADTLVTPLYGRSRDSRWIFPLAYWDDDELVTPLWWQAVNRETGGLDFGTIPPIFGKMGDGGWLFPLAWWDETSFLSPLWWQTSHPSTGALQTWMVPPLLTGGGVSETGTSYLYSPLGGYNEKASGVFPLWYEDPDGFYSLPYCQKNTRNGTVGYSVPLLSWHKSSNDGLSKTRGLLGFYGHDVTANGNACEDWLFPFYYYDGRNGDFQTMLFGRKTNPKDVDYWWLTPLVGSTTGEKDGFWFFPFVTWESNEKVRQLEDMMNADKLDASVVGKVCKEREWNKGWVTNKVFRIEGRQESEKLQFCLGTAGSKRTVSMDGGQNDSRRGTWRQAKVREMAGASWREGKERTVSIDEKVEFGNSMLFGGERQRVVNFDYDTKEKVFDGELAESRLLFGLAWSSRDEKFGGHTYAKRSLFWRLYHHEELNGDATTDIFPFITHDEKKDGHVETSFFWRLFRYENDPKAGTSLDLFFVPIKRP